MLHVKTLKKNNMKKSIQHRLVILMSVILIALFQPLGAQQVIKGDWNTQANDYSANIGKQYTFYFPPNGTISSRVWGTDIYTYDCSIATAAVHAGYFTAQQGGTVTIEIRPGQSSYKGSIRNGVTSKDWGPFGGSFVFIKGTPNNNDPSGNVIRGDWNTQANDYSGNIGYKYTFYFPPNGTISSRVWGTDVYTYDCSIASAAVHAGLINARDGGTVTIEITPGQSSYKGTTRNGVSSKDWGSFEGSFVFVRSTNNPPPPNVIKADWNTQANDYSANIGKRYTFYFPANGTISGRVWGTDIYTYDCSIASAAVHAGLITVQNGGMVTIEIRPGQSSYQGSTRNGVSSKSWGAFGGSFVFVR
jgi:hypothetical protein